MAATKKPNPLLVTPAQKKKAEKAAQDLRVGKKPAPKRKPKLVRVNLFDAVLAKAAEKGFSAEDTKKATDWYYKTARSLKEFAQRQDLEDKKRAKSKAVYGRMFMYEYDAKHKKTLPYWDKFPLVFPIGKAKKGFYGLNFHYIPYTYRLLLLKELYKITSNNRFDETTKLAISYDILKSVSKSKYYLPCIKHYLSARVSKPIYRIEASEWAIAIALPIASFQKASENKVHKDSAKMIRTATAKPKKKTTKTSGKRETKASSKRTSAKQAAKKTTKKK